MTVTSGSIHIVNSDGTTQDIPFSTAVTPIPPSTGKYVYMYCPNWNTLANLPLASQLGYFVLTSSATGVLSGGNDTQEQFINSSGHASLCIGGAAQNAAAITSAVNSKTGLVNSIAAHMTQYGYKSVTLDIEDTNITASSMLSFLQALRTKLGPTGVIHVAVQPYQINTVWSSIGQAPIDFVSVMLYDFGPYNHQSYVDLTNAWCAKVPKAKVLAGVGPGYPQVDGGLDTTQYAEMCDSVNSQGWGGVAIWQNAIYTAAYQSVTTTKFPVFL